jgi:hypothetical protein
MQLLIDKENGTVGIILFDGITIPSELQEILNSLRLDKGFIDLIKLAKKLIEFPTFEKDSLSYQTIVKQIENFITTVYDNRLAFLSMYVMQMEINYVDPQYQFYIDNVACVEEICYIGDHIIIDLRQAREDINKIIIKK